MKPLPPELTAWLQDFNELLAELERQGFVDTPETAREGLARLTAGLVSESPDLACVNDTQADGPAGAIPLRIYQPDPDKARPLLVYLHGGGHMAGSIEVYDPICRKLTLATGRVVVSVDYRLAPEHPYPAGLDDAEATLRQVFGLLKARGISFQRRLALGGDSGGGAMSATLAHRLQDDPEVDIEQQLLEENGRGYLLHSDKIRWYFDQYLQRGEDREAVSPLHMEFTSGLPETMLVTAGYDPLRDEGLAYLERTWSGSPRPASHTGIYISTSKYTPFSTWRMSPPLPAESSTAAPVSFSVPARSGRRCPACASHLR